MPHVIPSSSVLNLETLEVDVAGPPPANKLFIFSGQVPLNLSGTGGAGNQVNQPYTVTLPTTIGSQEFVRGSAVVSASDWAVTLVPGTTFTGTQTMTWNVAAADVVWDDATEQLQLYFEISLTGTQGGTPPQTVQTSVAAIGSLSFQAMVLAAASTPA